MVSNRQPERTMNEHFKQLDVERAYRSHLLDNQQVVSK